MVAEPKPGDLAEVKTKKNTHTGIIMPRPALITGDDLIVKLDSGYNIGIARKDITSITLIKQHKQKKESKKPPIKFDKKKPTISILSTGGTISSKVDYRTGGVYASYTASDLLESMPELSDIANIKSRALMNVMSEDMTPGVWLEIAAEIAKELNSGVDGVVVTHGTDTMHFSTAAVSFLLPNLSKPVVFTGSQRSSDRGSADSFLNLTCSISFAVSDVCGVYLVMHGSLNDTYCYAHLGTKVRKMHTSRRDAFKSINAHPAAKVFPDGRITYLSKVKKRQDLKTKTDLKFEEKIGLVRVFPGMPPKILDFYLEQGYNGLVIEGTALGHVPTEGKMSLIPKIKKAISKGVIVAMTTQCLYGRVHPHVYTNLRKVSHLGVIYCEDMLPETAYVKLGWVLGHTKEYAKAKQMMLTNYAGEITERTPLNDDTDL